MGDAQPIRKKTEEEYLEMENASAIKHEFYQGEVFAMAGGSVRHNLIVSNAIYTFRSKLKDSGCKVFPSDMRLYCVAPGTYTYPDVSVICGPVHLHRTDKNAITNPRILIEVLSPSTQHYDLGSKFDFYKTIPTLKEMLMVSSTETRVLHSVKQNDFQWLQSEYRRPEDVLLLDSVGISIDVAELYEHIDFKNMFVQEDEAAYS